MNDMSMLLKNFITETYIKKTKFDYGSFIIPVYDTNFVRYLNAMQILMKKIDTKHIVQFEKEPHITILGGIKSILKENLKQQLTKVKMKSFYVEIDNISLFRNINDVVILKCNSNQLNSLYRQLSNIPHVKLHKQFIPHITIAYVKSGYGPKYLEVLKKYFKSGKLKVSVIQYSDNMGNKLKYKLKDSKGIKNVSTSNKTRLS